MRILRTLAIALALSLIIGELWRSWGAGRPIAFVMDDLIMGGLLLVGAILMRAPTARRHALFSAGWAVCAGMLYGSFFNKVLAPSGEQAGNWDFGTLTMLVGVAFATSIIGLVASLALTPKDAAKNV